MMKSKLLVLELWGLGDLSIATPFLRAASRKYQVTLLAKPHAVELQPALFPDVEVVPFTAPWTKSAGKYRFHAWPWREIFELWARLRKKHFDHAVSVRWDPRDHWLIFMARAQRRYGYPRLKSQAFLTDPLPLVAPDAHRYESWRRLGQELGVELPAREQAVASRPRTGVLLVHSGAGHPVRIWPLDRMARLVHRLRAQGYTVQVGADMNQRDWWRQHGEISVVAAANVTELLKLIEDAGLFIGNDSGPGHLAAVFGIPTFTLFGPQLPEWFAPLHPAAEWIEGKACPYRPCWDCCRFPRPHCIEDITEEEVFHRVEQFVAARLSGQEEKQKLSF